MYQKFELHGGASTPKMHRYGQLLRDMLADQKAWIADRSHERRVTEANGRDSVAMAEAGAAPHATAMIGDTGFDMAMGRAAGAHAVGVSWGYHAPDLLIAAGAHCIVDRAEGLAAAMLACLDGVPMSAS